MTSLSELMMPNTITAAGNLVWATMGTSWGFLTQTPVILAVVFLVLGEVLLVGEEPESLVVDGVLQLVQELQGLV
ncbi:Uncharacterized protein FKW44_000254 [Caligus rogercresseyi]|uniref:Uncharacterized protein n=1 Tax=Caligus rogercresseyi TaxID=217165 RepID=A0A7T8QUR3_CALRO|nr:Uncharacterized protein FKW44_000254 [Caligus rogercresseyi]